MAETTIEWTRGPDGSPGKTWNPTTGCDRISPGCDGCYALKMASRLKLMGQAKYQNDGDPSTSGPGFALTVHPDALTIPFHWRKPRKVFVDSMSDLFHADVTDEFIAEVFAVMALTPQHTYQVLTKRPQRMAALLSSGAAPGFWSLVMDAAMRSGHEYTFEVNARLAAGQRGDGLPNVWLGTSIESDRYTFRADHLRATPAAVRFISAEPLIGPLPSLNLELIDWLIVGGGSGDDKRPMHPSWVRDLRDRCMLPELTEDPQDRHTAFFFKQWGTWGPDMPDGSFGTVYSRWDEDQIGTVLGVFDHGGSVRTRTERLEGADSIQAVYATGRAWRMEKGRKDRRILDGQTWDDFPHVSAAVSS